jgi:hypothetical protein
MIPEIREQFNAKFDPKVYKAFIEDIQNSNRQSLEFRVCETPLFITDELRDRLIYAANDVLSIIRQPNFAEKCKSALPPGLFVPNETPHPHFLQVDFALCKDNNGEFIPQLIELQGFPSLYAYQHYFDQKLREYFEIPKGFVSYFSGLSGASYLKLLGEILLGDCDPENVVLLEIQPDKQKTRIDFYLTEKYFGIPYICVTEVIQRGKSLFYRKNGREIPIKRIYYRFIFDELVRKNINISFDVTSELDVEWIGHPHWFFKISKHTLPLIKSQYCPPTFYLHTLNQYPEDLHNYVLKPLYSFAGLGVQVDVTREMLDEINDKSNYILQKKIQYAPIIKTPDGYSQAEVRLMFLWDKEPILVNNLLRTSKGKMMGVDYNKNKTWVGSSLVYHRPEV